MEYLPESSLLSFCEIQATIICRIVVYNWLSSSEYSNISQIKLLIPEWFSAKEPVKAEFEIIVMSIRRIDALLNNFFE